MVNVKQPPVAVNRWYRVVCKKTGRAVKFPGPFYCFRIQEKPGCIFCLDSDGSQRLFTIAEYRFEPCRNPAAELVRRAREGKR
jgi:hypothetical protein